jgi:hypothetical protein
LATLFAFHANTLLFLTARKTLKPSRHDLLHYLLKMEREASPIRMDIVGRRLARKTWWAQGSFGFATMSRVIRIAPVGLRGRFRSWALRYGCPHSHALLRSADQGTFFQET